MAPPPAQRPQRTHRRHDADAGGDPHLLERKADLRDRIWSRLEDGGVGRFPGPRHRISNFVGAEAAAERLRGLEVWRAARTVKANPDSPQWPVRQRALEDGKTVFMAVPRLAEEEPFFLLDPDHLADTPRRSSSFRGASASARTVAVERLEPVDLVVTGCVAVTEEGVRLGKGGGFADLEFALASEAGMIDAHTTVVTTVHELQVLPAGAVPTAEHDVRVDLIVTPERVIEVRRDEPRPPGRIRWEALTADKIAAIPLLTRLATQLPSPPSPGPT